MKNRAIILGNLIFGISSYIVAVIYLYQYIKGYSSMDPGVLVVMPVTAMAAVLIGIFKLIFHQERYRAIIRLYLLLIAVLLVPLLQFGAEYGRLLNMAYMSILSFFATPGIATLYWACLSILPIIHIISLASGIFMAICIKRKEHPHD